MTRAVRQPAVRSKPRPSKTDEPVSDELLVEKVQGVTARTRAAEALRAPRGRTRNVTEIRRIEVDLPEPEPDPFDLDQAIADMPIEFVECRDMNHSWRRFSARWMASEHHYESILRCARCQAEKVRFLSSTGRILSAPKYEYREGYLLPKGHGNLSSDDRDRIRLASVIAGTRQGASS